MTPRSSKILAPAALAAALALAAFGAAAQQSYRCVGADGKKYYGSSMPQQCIGQPVEILNAQGRVTKRIDPAASAAERDKKAAEDEERKKREAISKEEGRRNRALLATYTSVNDIEEARSRALADNAKLVKEAQARIAEIRKRQAGYAKEMEFYSDSKAEKGAKAKPASSNPPRGAKPPPKLVEDIRMAEVDLKLQEEALEQRKKQVEVINAKYDEDKNRFLALTQRK